MKLLKRMFEFSLAVLIVAAVFFSSCTSNLPYEKKDVIASANGTQYAVVRGEYASTSSIEAAVDLRKSIGEICGVMPEIKTDLEVPQKGIVKGEYEILVGETNRDESNKHEKNLRPKDFVIDFSTSRIVVLGGSGEATKAAVGYFKEKFLFSDHSAVAIPEDTFYLYDHPYPNVVISSTPIDECFVFADNISQKQARTIKDVVYRATDKYIKIANEETPNHAKGVRFVVDRAMAPLVCEVRTDGNGIVELASASIHGFEKCVELFEKILCSQNAQTCFNSSFSQKEEYTVKSITEYSGKKHFVGNTDKDPLSYEAGEEMVFKIGLYAGDILASCPKFSWTVSGDDGNINKGVSDGSSGEITIKASVSVPGYVRVIVKACDENGKEIEDVEAFEGGAGAGFSEIKQGKPEPADFDEFWQKQYDSLLDIKPEIISSVEVGGKPGYKVFDVRVSMGDMDPVSGYITYPENAQPGTLKIRTTYMGYGVASPAVNCEKDAIFFSVNAHSIVNGESEEFYKDLRAKEFASYGFEKDKNSNPETVYFRQMIMRDVQAVRCLMASELWDGERIELSGGSQGAFQATAVAAILGEKVTKVTLSIPWMCDLGGITIGRIRGWRPDYTDTMGYYDTVNFAKRVACPTFVNAGLGDYVCPPSGVTALYHNLSCPKQIEFYQNRTHSYMPDVKLITKLSEGMENIE